MAATSNQGNQRFLTAIIRAALDRPEGDDLAVLEAKLEALEPTAGQETKPTKKAPAKAPPAATKARQGAVPDRDGLGRRRNKPYGQQQGR